MTKTTYDKLLDGDIRPGVPRHHRRRFRHRTLCTDPIETDQAAIDAYLETHPVTHLPTGAESSQPTCWTKTGNHIGNFMKTVARYK